MHMEEMHFYDILPTIEMFLKHNAQLELALSQSLNLSKFVGQRKWVFSVLLHYV